MIPTFRDLGEHIRKHIKSLTNPASLTSEATTAITIQIDSLERLANNVYGKQYKRIHNSSATGLSVEQCNQVLSSEFLQYLKEGGGKWY